MYLCDASSSSGLMLTTQWSLPTSLIYSISCVSTGSIKSPTSTSPLFIISYIMSAVAVCIAIWTNGYLDLNLRHISASFSTTANSPHPMVTVPSTYLSAPCSSSIVRPSRSMISSARLLSRIPSCVNVIFLPVRTKSDVPSSFSSCASCLDNVGCVICNCSAAFVKLCSLATIRKYFNTLSSIFTLRIH